MKCLRNGPVRVVSDLGEVPMKNLKTIVVAGLIAVAPASGSAHEWQATSAPLSQDQVASVLDTLIQISEDARSRGWVANGPSAADPIARFYSYYLSSEGAVYIDEEVDRVIVAFEALRLGEVDSAGAYTEGADVLRWLDHLHPSDVVAVEPHMERLQAWWSSVPGASQ